MARKSYYKPYRRTYGSKKKWASNIRQGTLTGSGVVLVENSVQTASPTPIIVKAGNFKIQGDMTVSASSTGTISMYIFLIYAPEGIGTSSSDLNASILAHPEWVMGWTAVDTPVVGSGTSSGNKFSISSRLKRNLNSGDRIILYMQYATSSSTANAEATYTAQFFTCAN